MTTLPQTTTVRVPRTTGPAALMVPGVSMPAGQMPIAQPQMSGADVWRVIRANWIMIASSVVVFAVLGVITFFLLAHYYPKFTAVGLIEVQPTIVIDPLQSGSGTTDRNAIELEQSTQVAYLKHDSLLSAVLQRSTDLRNTGWFQEFKDDVSEAKDDLLGRLEIRPIPDTKVIQVSVSCGDPKDAKIIVEQLVDQHLRQQGETRRNVELRRSQTLSEKRNQDQARLNDLNDQLRQRGSKLAVDAMGVPGHLNAKEQEAARLMTTLIEQQGALDAAKTAYDRASTQLQSGQDPADIDEMIARDALLNNYRQSLDNVDVQIAELQKLGDDHPTVKQTKARCERSSASMRICAPNRPPSTGRRISTASKPRWSCSSSAWTASPSRLRRSGPTSPASPLT